MASDQQAQETHRETGTDMTGSHTGHHGDPERPNLPGIEVDPKDRLPHPSGGAGPMSLFAKVCGIRR